MVREKALRLKVSQTVARAFTEAEPKWCVFPFGVSQHLDPTLPLTTLKTVWGTIKETAGIAGRWHDNRQTLITELAESGAGDQTIMGHCGPRLTPDAGALLAHPHGRQAEGPGSHREQASARAAGLAAHRGREARQGPTSPVA